MAELGSWDYALLEANLESDDRNVPIAIVTYPQVFGTMTASVALRKCPERIAMIVDNSFG